MKKVVIIGGGGHCKVILNILTRDYPYYKIVGYIDKQKKQIDLPYLGSEENLNDFDPRKYWLVIGIGQTDQGKEREKLIKSLIQRGFRFLTIISKNSIIASSSKIGEGTVILDNVIINVDSIIGKFCILNTGCIVEHDCAIGDFVHLAPRVTLSGGVKIGNNCFIGAGAVVKHYTTICSEVIIGAGAVVVKNIDIPGIYVGIPAKIKK